jgi:hypothetical protein
VTLDFAIGAALAALLILGGQWCADARRRRLEHDRLERRQQQARHGFVLVDEAPCPPPRVLRSRP